MFNFLKIYKGLPRNVYILFLVQFINRFGDFVVPFLSLYLITKLGYSLKIAGALVTCAVILQVPGSMLAAMLADNFSRKRIYIIAQTLAASCILFCGFTNKKILIIVLLLASSFCAAGVKPMINTMAFDLLKPKERKIGASLLYLGINLGVSVGPLLAGFLFNHYLKIFFICDAATSLIAVCIVAFNIEERKVKNIKMNNKSATSKNFIFEIVKRPELILFLIIYLVYCFIYVQNSFSLPLMLENTFKAKGTIYFGYIMSINAVTVLSITAAITYLTRKKTALINITLGGIFYGIGFGMIGISNSLLLYGISTILWTIGEILISTNTGAYVANKSPDRMRARCAALITIFGAIGRSLGVFTMGGYIQSFSISAVWPAIMFLGFIASAFMYALHVYVSKKDVEEQEEEKMYAHN